jgi:hypothetical protein
MGDKWNPTADLLHVEFPTSLQYTDIDGGELTRLRKTKMYQKQSAHSGPDKWITLRRDKKGALKFHGERIGAATRTWGGPGESDEKPEIYELSAKLFKTTGGKYVVGVEVYDRTEERYKCRDAVVNESLDALAELLKGRKVPSDALYYLDDDILGELFEDTEVVGKFVELVD